MYGHIKQMAEAEKRGIEQAGGTADIYQCVKSVSTGFPSASLTTLDTF